MTENQIDFPETDSIPTALRDRDQWICWRTQNRDGKETKVPVIPDTGDYASATDPDTWRSFEDALEYYERGDAAGIGFVFTEADPFVGVDLDDCRDPETGSPDPEAREIIVELESFTEVSPSGTGYHVIVRGSIPGDRSRRGSVEMYETARFFTVTGDNVDATPGQVIERPDALKEVYNEYIAETESSRGEGSERDSVTASSNNRGVTLEDDELLERARNAGNGEKFDRLWRGSISGYDSQSEADMALCCLLAFWTGGDGARVDRLFRQSRLLREKWDEVHYADGSTYGEKTVERAIANTDEFYTPSDGDGSRAKGGDEQEQAGTAQQQTGDRARSPIEQTVGGNDGTRAAYLAEKNQLLTERVSTLEATLEQKNERIEALEADICSLRDALGACEKRLERREQAHDPAEGDEATEGRNSFWQRTKRSLGETDE